MKGLPPLARISLGLVVLTMSLLLTGDFIFENSVNRAQPVLDARKRLSESLAVQFSSLIAKNDLGTVQSTLFAIVRRDPEVLSAALRSEDGKIYTDAGVHQRYWEDLASGRSTATQAQVPLFKGDQRWGTVEIRFRPLPSSLTGFFSSSFAKLVLFVSLAGFLGYLIFMKKTLRHLDPRAVIPARVKTALDALTEGVVLVDEKANIVLVNSTFSAKVGSSEKSLMGCSLASLPWISSETRQPVRELPWTASVTEGKNRIGKALTFDPPDQDPISFIVNASPIVDDQGRARGALATFDDVTELESKNARLRALVNELGASQDEVKRQNEKLHLLATRDPLTNCLNRRSFFEFFEKELLSAQENGASLSCIMVDIDHFKKVNDTYGHAIGDQVIQKVADLLRSGVRSMDLISRYGGEEFCVVLPGTPSSVAMTICERIRAMVETDGNTGIQFTNPHSITASLGVSSLEFGARDVATLVDQADKALYASKESGRNQVTCWNKITDKQVA